MGLLISSHIADIPVVDDLRALGSPPRPITAMRRPWPQAHWSQREDDDGGEGKGEDGGEDRRAAIVPDGDAALIEAPEHDLDQTAAYMPSLVVSQG